MNPKINLPDVPASGDSGVFGRGFLLTVSTLTILALTTMMLSDRMVDSTESGGYVFRQYCIFPWIVASGKTIANGLAEFSGKIPDMPSASLRVTALGSLLFMFVICPTIFFFRWRDVRLKEKFRREGRPLMISGLVSAFCYVITVYFAVAIVPLTVLQYNTHQSMREGWAVQSNKDRIVNTIGLIATSLRQYRILPKSAGGGQGSFSGFTLPVEFKQSHEASFTIAASNDTATIEARSLSIPKSSLSVKLIGGRGLDTGSRYFEWTQEGKFQ
jgi:hypothetical protein